ncbi:P-loop NTPase fold protein [Caballeronia sp. LZ019]|uniref:KAP family P-loop NTPase fold protein n=1 Tax=Caballeronia sp. LZ019 TaxID=3038555 RepID=UPI00286776C1|nr:P-loop NTPase fold protein [Caballeronia sp. LZ019]MDR5810618.1 P-loop NTPase fold protein [Caballeronia sp. LZ019]
MWHDVEATSDLLNFEVVANTAAQLIRDSDGEPISVGISGNWGTGKSSLVKMVGTSLRTGQGDGKRYLFVEFNAWLYQGFDDAKVALLQSVSDVLSQEANSRKTFVDKAIEFGRRVQWFRALKIAAPAITASVVGGAVGGPIGAIFSGVSSLVSGVVKQSDLDAIKKAFDELSPELKELLKEKGSDSPQKEIEGLREAFKDLLASLDVTLVVLVDDLDRCMPDTAISTLEAIRLLLFLPRTAFIIAADEKMIRSSVRAHFAQAHFDDELVTSYFDKLIQIPLRVPRLGVNEVKAYVLLLLMDLAVRRKRVKADDAEAAKKNVLKAVREGWLGGLHRKTLNDALGKTIPTLEKEVDIADQLAPILATVEQISGNPRLIKRFLNNLVIRENVAKAHGMNVSFEHLVKLQLFERCATPAAFDFLVNAVNASDTGRPEFLRKVEQSLKDGEAFVAPDNSWNTPFVTGWVSLSPPLAETDLRPLLHLSRDRVVSLGGLDELSRDAHAVLEGLFEAKSHQQLLVDRVRALGEGEAELLMNRMKRRVRSQQWDSRTIRNCLHLTDAFPALGPSFCSLLDEAPPKERPQALIPLIVNEPWAKELLVRWAADVQTPQPVRNAIALKKA